MRLPRSIRFRIVAGVGLTLALVLGVGAVLLVEAVERRLIDEAERSLRASLGEVRAGEGNLAVPEEALLPVEGSDLLVQLIDEGEEVVAAVLDPDGDEPVGEVIVDPADGEIVAVESFEEGGLDDVEEEPLVDAVLDGVRVGGDRLTVTTTLASVRTSVSTLRQTLWLVVPATVVIGVVGAWLWVGRALRPVKQIARHAGRIGTETIGDRVPVPESADEVERLARVLNDMLDRIEAGVVRQQQFVSDASHELRTPLATVRAGAEMVQLDSRGALAGAADDMMAEIDRMDGLIGDLLALARLDESAPHLERVDLQSLVRDQVDITGDPRIQFAPGPPTVAAVDRAPVERAVANLLANARRHASSRVDVVVTVDAAQATVAVTDDGSGVDAGDRERIFDRFVRLDDGRARDTGGAGLGLAIVSGVARAHGGSVRVTDRPDRRPGARFVLVLPINGPDQPVPPSGPPDSSSASRK